MLAHGRVLIEIITQKIGRADVNHKFMPMLLKLASHHFIERHPPATLMRPEASQACWSMWLGICNADSQQVRTPIAGEASLKKYTYSREGLVQQSEIF